MHVVCVAGARPNFMKVKPVMDALEARGAQTTLVHTGQHYDPLMSQVFFEDLGIRAPDHHLGVAAGTQAEQTAGIMVTFEALLADLLPDLVVVVGDVNSTLAAGLVAAKSPAALAHVEAGLRSRNWAMPEEVNRVVVDSISDHLLAPSPDAEENLLAEGRPAGSIAVVGNVMVDSLLANLERARRRPILGSLGLEDRPFVLVTLHRPSNVDEPASLEGFVRAFEELADDLPVVFPVHPRTRSHLPRREISQNVLLTEPLGYLDFICLEQAAAVVITDSGGVQEETTVLGVPCLTVRDETERPITVMEGTNKVIGAGPEAIVAETRRALRRRTEGKVPDLWDGRAGERIAAFLLRQTARVCRAPGHRA